MWTEIFHFSDLWGQTVKAKEQNSCLNPGPALCNPHGASSYGAVNEPSFCCEDSAQVSCISVCQRSAFLSTVSL